MEAVDCRSEEPLWPRFKSGPELCSTVDLQKKVKALLASLKKRSGALLNG